MNTADVSFAPRTIAQARSARARYASRLMRLAVRRIARRFRLWSERLMLARQYQRELMMLMQADDRMLMDIGITRADVRAAAEDRWWISPRRMLDSAAQRRADAMAVAEAHRPRALPRMASPSLAPLPPRAVEVSNFR